MQRIVTARTITAVAATLLLAGCAHNDAVKPQFGDSVRHMTRMQIYDMDAAYNPDPNPVGGGDVYRLNRVLESHRNDVASPTEAIGAPEVDIRGGNQ